MPYADREKRLEYWRRYGEKRRRQNPDWYAAYYAENRKKILAANRARRKLTGKKRGLCRDDYREMLVNILLERDGSYCGHCGGLMVFAEISVDHVKPRSKGGTNDAMNLRLLHRVCNQRRTRRG